MNNSNNYNPLQIPEKKYDLLEIYNKELEGDGKLEFAKHQKEFFRIFLWEIEEIYREDKSNDIEIPISLLLAQAILESWWNTSVYAKKKNNPFGIYFFKDWKKKIRKFHSLKDAISYYINNYRTNEIFEEFRELLRRGEYKGTNLESIEKYAEDNTYITQIKYIIKTYKLRVFDKNLVHSQI